MKDVRNKLYAERVTPDREQYFFGYYDISPESPDGSKILIHKAPFIDRAPEIRDELEVGYMESDTLVYTPIGKTAAWNFQEGSRLQWLDETRVIYNVREGHQFHSVVYDIAKRSRIRTYDIPIYSVSCEYALSYSFTNNKYSYAHTDEELLKDPWRDGVYILHLDSGRYHRIISNETLDELAGITVSNGQVEYCVFNPAGDQFYLYYRWSETNGAAHTMLCVSDLEGCVKILLNSNFISHAGWCGNGKITAWGRLPSRINTVQGNSFLKNTGLWKVAVAIFHHTVKSSKLRQRITNDAYIMFDLASGKVYKLENTCFTSDGHCTWSSNEQFMLTDTYPDEDNKRHLMIYDIEQDLIYLLGKFYSYPEKMKEKDSLWNCSALRCDLHPKWGQGKRYIYFDSVHEGYRGMYRMDVSKILENRMDDE